MAHRRGRLDIFSFSSYSEYYSPCLITTSSTLNRDILLKLVLIPYTSSSAYTPSSSTLSHSHLPTKTIVPPGHLLLVPLHTNRSPVSLRCGVSMLVQAKIQEKIVSINSNSNNIDSNISSGNVEWNPDNELPRG